MKRKYHSRKNRYGDMMEFGRLSASTGIMTSVVSSAGGNTSGLSTLSSFYPMVGSALGGRMVLDELKRYKKKKY